MKYGKGYCYFMISSVVFDIGQVLVDFRWREYIEELGFDEDKTERLKRATVGSPLWDEQDRGNYSMEELIQLHSKQDPQLEPEIRIFFEQIKSIVIEREYAAPLMERLQKKGYGVYILSNYGKYAYELVKGDYRFLNYIDGGMISYQVNLIKPDKKIYESLIAKYQLNPNETLFIDDRLENIVSAQELGFQTIHFQTIEQVLDEMKRLNVEIDKSDCNI